ncbi:hypothetical protein SGCZBJ_08760 [Caulobacter zeae]|uniref:HEPN AbiU2-like domain-containing protein n=1 Tax=Caulobacter zeae TaxID=2055137 RepID=A0A2N5DL99_9CAUL|nr:hypothetical protein [Caulobacter zeae]PLR26842.1 hypothetical protein SGCZBJ_08760 [Caulobacter zeae]
MALKDEILAVANFSVHLRSLWRHYQILFEDGELRRNLLHRVAPTFFDDLNQILIEQLILQICRLTDPAVTMKRTNLSLDYVLGEADFGLPVQRARAQTLRDSIEAFRTKIIPARNRLIGHLDRDAVMAGVPLGGANEADWIQFWEDLDQFLNLIHTRYVDPSVTFHLNNVGMISDADSLVEALKESTYFHLALAESAITLPLAEIASRSEFRDA